MKEKVIDAIKSEISKFDLVVSDVYQTVEDGITYLKIELDSDTIIDLNRITDASRVINPIIDELDLIDEEYVLDIYAKEKESDTNE